MSDSGSTAFKALLQLQDVDSDIDRQRYRREHLPAHEAMKSVQVRAGSLRPRLADATAARDAVAQRQSELEAEIDSIQRRVAEINSRLYGSVQISPRDAQSMSEEVVHLNERRTALEDVDLEVMEELEPLQADLVALEGEAQGLSAESRGTQADINAGQTEIDANLEVLVATRETLAAAVPPALLAEYNRIRPSLGGIAVAPLVGGSCGGCHLSLAAGELDRIRKAAPDEVVHCDECGRIIVRVD